MSEKTAHHAAPYKKSYSPASLVGVMYVYQVLFLIHILCYAVLQHTVVISARDQYSYDVDYEALVYLFSYSIFTFFLIIKASVTYSIYEYYVALFILFQRLIVITTITFNSGILTYKPQFAATIVLCVLNYLEFAYLIVNLYTRRQEINIYLFKLTGVDPAVNNAYAVRKMLEVLGYVNVFVSFFFFFSYNFHTNPIGIGQQQSLRAAYLGLYICTYFFTYACIEKEIRLQRIIALALNIATIVYLIIYAIISFQQTEIESFHNQIYYQTIVDVGVQLTVMLVFSCLDFFLFGSGLREALGSSTTKLHLPSD